MAAYKISERISAGVALLVAIVGQLNSWVFGISSFGISPDRLSILLYIPLAAVLFLIVRRKSREDR
jgi:hypothetical protein